MEDKGVKPGLDNKKKALLGASLFVLIVSAAGLYYFLFAPNILPAPDKQPQAEEATPETIVDDCPGCLARWLDGIEVPAEKAKVFPVAVMIDNDINARPQNGLARASLVYEAPVEGRITRYMAVFPADIDLASIGPVRSARPYFVSWAEELRALYVHAGGSDEALALIKKSQLTDFNEFYNGSYFHRELGGRPAPHNLLLGSNDWRAYLEKRGLSESPAESWQYKEENEHATSSPDIDIRFSPSFRPTWRYLTGTNEYQRYFNGELSKDGEGIEIKAKNVIIHLLDSKVVDDYGRLHLGVAGNGKAVICLDGLCQEGAWKKNGSSRTRYYDLKGEEIKFNPGVTWIEAADGNTSVVY
ncbi:MAG: DUF3048 domain-containing protein [Bacillota bacterium]